MTTVVRKLSPKLIRNVLKYRSISYLEKLFGKARVDNGNYHIVEPGNVSPQCVVPDHVIKPSYHKTGQPLEFTEKPELKTEKQILQMRKACKLAASILADVQGFIEVGVTTDSIDVFIHNLIIKYNAYPSPLNYKHFPKSICTSVNNVACHGIPDDRKLQDGDIINVDITTFFEGYHGDCSKTFLVGNVDDLGKKLVEATETCLNAAISICKPGCRFSEIGVVTKREANRLGFNVVSAFIGHGIGHYFHGPPDIYHIPNNYPGIMQPGMTFTIEPILTAGSDEIVILEDDWTAVTLDCARTAQFEHTILITSNGVEILT